MDKYLSFTDEAAAKAVLYRIEGAVEADAEMGIEAVEGYEVPNFKNIDTIGVIHKPTGATETVDGMEVPVMAAIPGWHVNVRLMPDEDGSALESFEVFPATPMRVWG